MTAVAPVLRRTPCCLISPRAFHRETGFLVCSELNLGFEDLKVLYQSKGIQKARMKVCAQLIQVEFEKVAMLNGSKEEQLSSAKAAATVASSAEPEEGIAANLRSGEDDAGKSLAGK